MVTGFATLEEAQSVPEPKEILIDFDKIIVYTGDDITKKLNEISATDFRDRFTKTELVGIEKLKLMGDETAMYLLAKIYTLGANLINLNSLEVSQGLQYLASKNVLESGRIKEILSNV